MYSKEEKSWWIILPYLTDWEDDSTSTNIKKKNQCLHATQILQIISLLKNKLDSQSTINERKIALFREYSSYFDFQKSKTETMQTFNSNVISTWLQSFYPLSPQSPIQNFSRHTQRIGLICIRASYSQKHFVCHTTMASGC